MPALLSSMPNLNHLVAMDSLLQSAHLSKKLFPQKTDYLKMVAISKTLHPSMNAISRPFLSRKEVTRDLENNHSSERFARMLLQYIYQ